jgi:hypothetical protein
MFRTSKLLQTQVVQKQFLSGFALWKSSNVLEFGKHQPQNCNLSLNFCMMSSRYCATLPVNPQIGDQTLLDQNAKRSKEHQNEIKNNEYPEMNSIKHPNTKNEHNGYYVDFSRPQYEDYTMEHHIWTKEQLESIEQTHKQPTRIPDYLAMGTDFGLRFLWDLSTGFLLGRKLGYFKFSARLWLLRIVFLETAAGVPGMMFGMVRHLNSLRRLERDRGWIRTLLQEAENERIHLLTAMHLFKPGKPLRYAILLTQGIISNYLFVAYLISPRYCHSFVGYLEEQAVHTYTLLLQDIDEGKYPEFVLPASNLAKKYWRLDDNATWRDVFSNMRADEGNHRDVNHTLSDLTLQKNALNPFRHGPHDNI